MTRNFLHVNAAAAGGRFHRARAPGHLDRAAAGLQVHAFARAYDDGASARGRNNLAAYRGDLDGAAARFNANVAVNLSYFYVAAAARSISLTDLVHVDGAAAGNRLQLARNIVGGDGPTAGFQPGEARLRRHVKIETHIASTSLLAFAMKECHLSRGIDGKVQAPKLSPGCLLG